ncbi:MAG: hypothetical protein ACREYE_12365 [Gammaproteobacteria bacterium]
MSETLAITGKSVKLFKGHYTTVTANGRARFIFPMMYRKQF